MKQEPVLAAVTALLVAAFALLAAFGVQFTEAQVAASVGFVAAAYGLAAVVRAHVRPVKRRKKGVR